MHSQRGFTALIKVAMQHIRLAVSTFAGPAEECGAERSNEGKKSRVITAERK